MNKVLNKIRRNAGVLLEALFILFIVSNSFTDVSAQENTDQDHSYKATVWDQIILQTTPTNVANSSSFENLLSFDWAFSEVIVDLPTIILHTHKAFFLSVFERSAFYVYNSASAP
jgi:hypothetical protein